MKPINLKTEYLANPMGIDIPRPRFMWNAEGGITQTAYRIVARSGDEILWDSGKVVSASMTHIPYGGSPLRSCQRVCWSVVLWDEQDEAGPAGEGWFEMGLLEPADWKATWITGNYRVNRKKRYPVDCFRKSVSIGQKVRSARLYITACGLYEARLDGQRIGDFVLAPGHTDYRKRVQYQSYDVTPLLAPGDHALTVQLADGWYRGSCGAWGSRNQYGSETKLRGQLEILYENGSRETVVTDESWQWSCDGPIRFADNQDGEVVDANFCPGYGGSAKATTHRVVPSASNNVGVAEKERFTPTVTKAPNGRWLLDFGQNIAGYIRLNICAGKGQKLHMRFGEMLDREGNLTLQNIQCSNRRVTTPLQQVLYTCREGQNDYKTTFAVFGFRYAEVDTDLTVCPENVTAIAVYSDIGQTGTFESSNPLLDRFVDAVCWSTRSNSLDVPTDCPTRERHGWTGDAQIFFDTANYLFDYAAFSQKHLRDIYDWQRRTGRLPQIAPYGGVDFYMWTLNGSVGWADAGILIPYRFWKLYGDRQIIADYYDGMKRYAGFMARRCGRTGFLAKPLGLKGDARRYAVNSGQSYGEWAEPADVHPNDWKDIVAPHPEVSTAYTAHVMECMAQMARELGYYHDEAYFHRYAEGCRAAYQAMARTEAYTLDTDRQARLVRPLAFGLLDEAQTGQAGTRLLQALEHYRWRLGTGFLSTPLILDVLTDIDPQAAYRLLENEEMPGWLFMVKNGATTVWESWEGTQAQGGIASLNHYSKGAVCQWLMRTMCGIRVAGENRFLIAPIPGGSFRHARATYRSIYGRVECSWEKTGEGTYRYTVTVPANTSALFRFPDGTEQQLSPGRHRL